jgi:hypothetical protein
VNVATQTTGRLPPVGAQRRRGFVLLAFGNGRQLTSLFSHGFSFEFVGVVHKPIQNGIGKRRITNQFMPLVDRK